VVEHDRDDEDNDDEDVAALSTVATQGCAPPRHVRWLVAAESRCTDGSKDSRRPGL
jgi:hypothetical protein